jgi:hypothetical protein
MREFFIAGQNTIRAGNLLQQLDDDPDAFFLAESVCCHGEMKQVGRLDCAFFWPLTKCVTPLRFNPNAPSQGAARSIRLSSRSSTRLSRTASDIDEQHGERENRIILFGGWVRLVEPEQKAVPCVEHIASLLNAVCAVRIGAGPPLSKRSGVAGAVPVINEVVPDDRGLPNEGCRATHRDSAFPRQLAKANPDLWSDEPAWPANPHERSIRVG